MHAERMGIATVVISLMAAVAAVASWWAIRGQLHAIKEQTQAQRDISRETLQTQLQISQQAQQPYVWADLRPREDTGMLMMFVIGNSGPTVARNVVVDVQPRLPRKLTNDDIHPMHDVLAEGISSLPPGREISWAVGRAPDLIEQHGTPRRITITADGPYGPLPPVSYTISIAEMAAASAQPPGTLHEVATEVKNLTEAVKKR